MCPISNHTHHHFKGFTTVLILHTSFCFLNNPISQHCSSVKEPLSPNRISGAAKLFLTRWVICVLVIRFHPRMNSCPETICRWFTSSLSVSKSHFSFRKHELNNNKHMGDRSYLSLLPTERQCEKCFSFCFGSTLTYSRNYSTTHALHGEPKVTTMHG